MSKYIVRALDKDGKGYCEEVEVNDPCSILLRFSIKATGTNSNTTIYVRERFRKSLVCIDIDKMEEEDE